MDRYAVAVTPSNYVQVAFQADNRPVWIRVLLAWSVAECWMHSLSTKSTATLDIGEIYDGRHMVRLTLPRSAVLADQIRNTEATLRGTRRQPLKLKPFEVVVDEVRNEATLQWAVIVDRNIVESMLAMTVPLDHLSALRHAGDIRFAKRAAHSWGIDTVTMLRIRWQAAWLRELAQTVARYKLEAA